MILNWIIQSDSNFAIEFQSQLLQLFIQGCKTFQRCQKMVNQPWELMLKYTEHFADNVVRANNCVYIAYQLCDWPKPWVKNTLCDNGLCLARLQQFCVKMTEIKDDRHSSDYFIIIIKLKRSRHMIYFPEILLLPEISQNKFQIVQKFIWTFLLYID